MSNGLPDQVRKQEEDAQRLWNEQHGNTGATEPTPVDPNVEPAQEPDAKTTVPSVTRDGSSWPDAELDTSDFKHKYDVLQGKFDAEVPRISAENKQLRNHTIELSQVISTLQAEIEKLKEVSVEPEPVVAGDALKQLLSEEEMEEVESVMDLGLFSKVVSKLVKDQTQPLAKNMDNIQNWQAGTVEDLYYGKVDAIPNVEAVNASPEFNEWLDIKMPYTGQTRRSILKAAESSLNADTIVELFSDFAKGQKAGRTPRISPAQSSGGGTGVPPSGKIWTIKEVNGFYIDVQKGKYRGRDEEQKQTEQDIWNAQKEGRIRKT